MSKSFELQHSPAPWQEGLAAGRHDEDGIYIVDSTGSKVARTVGVRNFGPYKSREAWDRYYANARLLTASPELLYHLDLLVGYLECLIPVPNHPGPCGPNAGCDTTCMDAAHLAEDLANARTLIRRLRDPKEMPATPPPVPQDAPNLLDAEEARRIAEATLSNAAAREVEVWFSRICTRIEEEARAGNFDLVFIGGMEQPDIIIRRLTGLGFQVSTEGRTALRVSWDLESL